MVSPQIALWLYNMCECLISCWASLRLGWWIRLILTVVPSASSVGWPAAIHGISYTNTPKFNIELWMVAHTIVHRHVLHVDMSTMCSHVVHCVMCTCSYIMITHTPSYALSNQTKPLTLHRACNTPVPVASCFDTLISLTYTYSRNLSFATCRFDQYTVFARAAFARAGDANDAMPKESWA